jgi:hypothetical protein
MAEPSEDWKSSPATAKNDLSMNIVILIHFIRPCRPNECGQGGTLNTGWIWATMMTASAKRNTAALNKAASPFDTGAGLDTVPPPAETGRQIFARLGHRPDEQRRKHLAVACHFRKLPVTGRQLPPPAGDFRFQRVFLFPIVPPVVSASSSGTPFFSIRPDGGGDLRQARLLNAGSRQRSIRRRAK